MEGQSIYEACIHAMVLLFSGNPDLWRIIWTSFSVSLRATAISTPIVVLLAFLLAYGRFPGRTTLVYIFNALLSFPAVVVGLTLYLVLSRSGPLGDLHLLFTQKAMVIGQIMLSLPLMTVMCLVAFQGGDRRAWETARTLGAPPWRAFLTVVYDVRFGLIAGIIAGFGRVISEVGVSLMVGGNILNFTRNITTAIALETSKGAFSQGIALGFVLMLLAFTLNLMLTLLQGRKEGPL
ncbi:MAG: ABC transporter permease [Gammaproteobacteria bacterium]